MSATATLQTEAIVNYLHADIITKNRLQVEHASNELRRLKQLEAQPPTRVFTRVISCIANKNKASREDDRQRAELQTTIRESEAQLRQAKIIQNQVHTVSGMIVAALTVEEKVEEANEILPRCNAMIKTLTSSALAKEVESAREALAMKSLKEVAGARAKTVDAATAISAFLKVEAKWEAMKALGVGGSAAP